MFKIRKGEPWQERGVWKGARIDGGRTALVSCPECGQCASLSEHAIDERGSVTPSLVCPVDGCAFHQFVELEGWSPCGR